MTVDKAVSIIAPPGVYAGISVFGGASGINVNAAATDTVVLRGLTIDGLGGFIGIQVVQAGRVDVQQCVISNMGATGTGILDSSLARLYIDDTRIVGNGAGIVVYGGELVMTRSQVENNAMDGLLLASPPGPSLLPPVTIHAAIRSSLFAGNGQNGVRFFAKPGSVVDLAMTDSMAVRNTGDGLQVFGGDGGTIALVLTGSTVSSNGGNGLTASGASVIASVSGSTLARNSTFDMSQSNGAILRSFGNNALSGDGPSNISGTITPVPLN